MQEIYLPATVLTIAELDVVTEHYKVKYGIGLKYDEKPRRYGPDERAVIGRLYDRISAAGYHIGGVDKFGRLVFQKRTKTAVQLLLEQGLKKAVKTPLAA